MHRLSSVNWQLGHERVRERDFRERRHRFCRESSGDAKGDVSGVA